MEFDYRFLFYCVIFLCVALSSAVIVLAVKSHIFSKRIELWRDKFYEEHENCRSLNKSLMEKNKEIDEIYHKDSFIHNIQIDEYSVPIITYEAKIVLNHYKRREMENVEEYLKHEFAKQFAEDICDHIEIMEDFCPENPNYIYRARLKVAKQ